MRSLLAAIAVAAAWPSAAEDLARSRIADALSEALPELRIERIEPTPVAGLYTVASGGHVLYVSGDGRFLIQGGELFDVERRANLTEEARMAGRREVMDAIPGASLITFAPPEPRHVVTVFTDVDCPYCVRLHADVPRYNALGIAIRYAAYPRAGIPSASYDKTVSVWCADDPHAAIGDAKAGRAVEPRACDNPVAAHLEAGQRVGIRGTPAIVLADGTVLPGYLPPERLARALDGAR